MGINAQKDIRKGKRAYIGLEDSEKKWKPIILFQAMLIFLSMNAFASAFTFIPDREKGALWDVWVFHANDTYYLFYDFVPPGRGITAFAVATSKDGVHWKDHGPTVHKPYYTRGIGSGFTWKSPDFERDGKYQCNMSLRKDGLPTIVIAESTDLFNWKIRDNVYYRPDARWYDSKKGRWDCISSVLRPGGGYYGYCTATAKDGDIWCIGFGETLDGIHWKSLAPPDIAWGKWKKFDAMCVELGGAEFINGKYYLMINLSHAKGGGSHMLTFSSDKPEGPFVLAKKNPEVVYGDVHFSRFGRSPNEILVVQHYLTQETGSGGAGWKNNWDTAYMAPLKEAIVDQEGILRLGYWKGNESLKGKEVPVETPSLQNTFVLLNHSFNVNKGFVLEGTIKLPQEGEKQLPGIYLESGEERPTVIQATAKGTSRIGTVRKDGSDFQLRKSKIVWCGPAEVDREMTFGPAVRFRLLVRKSMLEFYMDDILFQIRALKHPPTGKVGIVGTTGSICDLKAWNMSFDEK